MIKEYLPYLTQLARLLFSLFCLYLVYQLTQQWALDLYGELMFPGWIQVSLFAIAAGGIFPRAQHFSLDNDSDIRMLTGGLWAFWLGMAASFLP
ncbi:hypothetical protein [Thiothrix nivea]|uniref:Uncharacterized protein n=1 Tax=Thiothrix nivea (strain ATCC 35100 / DSM 5205 / JP2) TaxID=870187 RepID=A0A656HJQ2_THINJ|nr:hypothetical protein [Thiothrix nivea]EIJ35736.1 hypothetical protein Thini_3218 [Thiothrix nivea DSM 5205]